MDWEIALVEMHQSVFAEKLSKDIIYSLRNCECDPDHRNIHSFIISSFYPLPYNSAFQNAEHGIPDSRGN